jgi:hypothetical protein
MISFDQCIAPLQRRDFVAQVLGRAVSHFPGPEERFDELITMAELDEVLSRLVVLPGMIRVKTGGDIIPSSRYLTGSISKSDDARRVDTAALEKYLQSGATLIMDNCQGLFPGIQAFTESLAEVFRTRVTATLFVVLKVETPIILHADDHDVFVCQMLGQKRWPIFTLAQADHVLGRGVDALAVSPTWQGTLRPGDALYVPRGWPHQPAAVVAPSLHVTFGVIAPTGADFLTFLLEQVQHRGVFRTELPLHAGAEERRAYNEALRDAVLATMSHQALNAYMGAQRLLAVARPLRLAPSRPESSASVSGGSSSTLSSVHGPARRHPE